MISRIPALMGAVCVALAALAGSPRAANEKISFITDAEIEHTIRVYATPIFQAAGLDPSAVRIYLVSDDRLNAFVTGGQKLFLNTGLLMRTEHPGQLIGVIAHEVGHIEGAHLSRVHEAMREVSAASIISFVLGAALMVGTGSPDIGQAVVLGGQQLGMRTLLQYTRTQESSADQAALKLLDATGTSSRGLMEFLQVLADQELLSARLQDPYVLTHPIARDRVDTVRNHVERSPYSDVPFSAAYQEMHRRLRAKLAAFLRPVARTLQEYKETDPGLEARYARAIAYYRQPNLDQALPLIDGLIAERPQDPYFRELKGQMLFENGRVAEALGPYAAAVQIAPDSPQLRLGLARAQLEMNDPGLVNDAIQHLRIALQRENDNAFAWRQIAIAYGRAGQTGMSALALGEEALLQGNYREARSHAERAEKLLPRGSPAWLQAQDALRLSQERLKERR